jgi:hypothetical protein
MSALVECGQLTAAHDGGEERERASRGVEQRDALGIHAPQAGQVEGADPKSRFRLKG